MKEDKKDIDCKDSNWTADNWAWIIALFAIFGSNIFFNKDDDK